VYERYVSGSYEGQKRQKAQSTKMKEMLAKRGHKDVQLNEYERTFCPGRGYAPCSRVPAVTIAAEIIDPADIDVTFAGTLSHLVK
jgi:hypothetical protein